MTREHSSPTNPIDKREYITLHAADEPSPECLAAFDEFLDAFGSLTPEQQAIAASAARQWALDSEQRQASAQAAPQDYHRPSQKGRRELHHHAGRRHVQV